LVVAQLNDEFIKGLKELDISPFVNMANPLDLGYVATEEFRRVGLLADRCDVADIILLNIGDPVPEIAEVAKVLQENIRASIVVSYLGGGEEEKKGRLKMVENGIPVFRSPERAVRGLGAMVGYTEFSKRAPNLPGKKFLPRREKGNGLDRRSEFILEPDAIKVLNQYGINYVAHRMASSRDEAKQIAEELGYPVVLKIVSKDVLHKSDVGGVITGLRNADEVKHGFDEVMARVRSRIPEAIITGILVCKEAPKGLDVIVGVANDPVIGPAIMFGLGGIFTEVMQDISFRIPPLERQDAEAMIREIRGYPLLSGVRGQRGYDISALTEMLLSVSQLVSARPQIAELDINPVRLFEKGLMVLDVRLIEASPNK
jgi:acyl-CoA synthetase (NDP forming)